MSVVVVALGILEGNGTVFYFYEHKYIKDTYMTEFSNKFLELKNKEEQLLCRTYGRYPLALVRGEGSLVWDIDGKEYVDLLAGIAVIGLGHCHPEVVKTLHEQAHKLWHVSNLFYQEEQLELAEKLLATCHMNKAFFCNSGAEANAAAFKLARRYMRKVKKRDAYEIITLSGAFHGRTLATVAATGQERFQDGFTPMPEGFKQVPYGDMQALRAAITEQTAGVFFEVIQGEGGIRPITSEYIKAIESLCREKDILFMVDEVQAGLGRTGKFWAFQNFDVKPDILTMAKALANGLPMGAILTTDEVNAGFELGSHATTFGGGALLSKVAATCIDILLRDNLVERAGRLGTDFQGKIRDLAQRMPGTVKEVRGLGLMLGIELTAHGKAVWEDLLQAGFICNLSHETTLRLLPALTVEEEQLAAFVEALEKILHKHFQM